MKKLLVVGVILLFLGLACAPSINANIKKPLLEKGLFEVSSQTYGIKDSKPNQVLLTNRQYSEVKDFLSSIENRFESANTEDEFISCLDDALVVLNRYKLLPDGMNLSSAYEFVFSPFHEKIGSSEDIIPFSWMFLNITGDYLIFGFLGTSWLPFAVSFGYILMVLLLLLEGLEVLTGLVLGYLRHKVAHPFSLIIANSKTKLVAYNIAYFMVDIFTNYKLDEPLIMESDKIIVWGFHGIRLITPDDNTYYFGRAIIALNMSF